MFLMFLLVCAVKTRALVWVIWEVPGSCPKLKARLRQFQLQFELISAITETPKSYKALPKSRLIRDEGGKQPAGVVDWTRY